MHIHQKRAAARGAYLSAPDSGRDMPAGSEGGGDQTGNAGDRDERERASGKDPRMVHTRVVSTARPMITAIPVPRTRAAPRRSARARRDRGAGGLCGGRTRAPGSHGAAGLSVMEHGVDCDGPLHRAMERAGRPH